LLSKPLNIRTLNAFLSAILCFSLVASFNGSTGLRLE